MKKNGSLFLALFLIISFVLPMVSVVCAQAEENTVYENVTNSAGDSAIPQTSMVNVGGIKMTNIYSDDMIFQRNKPIKIAGVGCVGDTLNVILNDVTVSTVIKEANWEVFFPPQPAVKSTTLTIESGGVSTEYKNVAIGEVIFCSGQSNMAYKLSNFSTLIPEADKEYKDIRLFFQDEIRDGIRKTDIPSADWRIATVDNAKVFSAVAFLTGKQYYLDSNEEVPVGLILASIGGTSITTWTDNKAYNNDPDLKAERSASGADIGRAYNNMIAPFENFTIGSFLWYQGEANTSLRQNYEKMLIAFIDETRENFKDPELPFIIIQLPRYDYFSNQAGISSSIGVRDSQDRVTKKVKNTALVVTLDTGEDNLHSKNKIPVAYRSMLALKHFINPDDTSLVWKAPEVDTITTQAGTTTLTFKDIGTGLKTSDGEAPKGFFAAGSDMVFHETAAVLTDNTIKIDTSGLTAPIYIRHAWAEIPYCNLVNSAGIPFSQFSSAPEQIYYNTRTKTAVPSEDPLSDPVYFSPMVRSITPGQNKILNDSEFKLEVEAFSFGNTIISKVEVFLDGQSVGDAINIPGTYKYSISIPNAAKGVHNVYAIAQDNMGTTSILQHPSKGTTKGVSQIYSFVFGNYVESIDNNTDITFDDYNSTDGVTKPKEFQTVNTMALSGGTPEINGVISPYQNTNGLKITSDAVGEMVSFTVPNAFNKLQNSWRYFVNTDIYFDADEGIYDADRIFKINAGSGAGVTYSLLSFRRVVANDNLVSFNLADGIPVSGFKFENNKWYHIQLEIDTKAGTCSVWINGISFFVNTTIATQSVKNNLKLGINSVSFEHTGKILAADAVNRGIQPTTTYIDNIQCGYVSYVDALPKEPVITLSPVAVTSENYKSSLKIENYSTEPITSLLVLAAYDDKNALIALDVQKPKTGTVIGGDTETIYAILPFDDNIASVKTFVFKDYISIQPLCESDVLVIK